MAREMILNLSSIFGVCSLVWWEFMPNLHNINFIRRKQVKSLTFPWNCLYKRNSEIFRFHSKDIQSWSNLSSFDFQFEEIVHSWKAFHCRFEKILSRRKFVFPIYYENFIDFPDSCRLLLIWHSDEMWRTRKYRTKVKKGSEKQKTKCLPKMKVKKCEQQRKRNKKRANDDLKKILKRVKFAFSASFVFAPLSPTWLTGIVKKGISSYSLFFHHCCTTCLGNVGQERFCVWDFFVEYEIVLWAT